MSFTALKIREWYTILYNDIGLELGPFVLSKGFTEVKGVYRSLGSLWLSKMAFFDIHTLALLTSSGAGERTSASWKSLAPAEQWWLKVNFRSTCWPLEELGKVSLPLVLFCWIVHWMSTFFLSLFLVQYHSARTLSPNNKGLKSEFTCKYCISRKVSSFSSEDKLPLHGSLDSFSTSGWVFIWQTWGWEPLSQHKIYRLGHKSLKPWCIPVH